MEQSVCRSSLNHLPNSSGGVLVRRTLRTLLSSSFGRILPAVIGLPYNYTGNSGACFPNTANGSWRIRSIPAYTTAAFGFGNTVYGSRRIFQFQPYTPCASSNLLWLGCSSNRLHRSSRPWLIRYYLYCRNGIR